MILSTVLLETANLRQSFTAVYVLHGGRTAPLLVEQISKELELHFFLEVIFPAFQEPRTLSNHWQAAVSKSNTMSVTLTEGPGNVCDSTDLFGSPY